jgi:hypothetical protein
LRWKAVFSHDYEFGGVAVAYEYGLFSTISESVDELGKVTDKTIKAWNYSIGDVQKLIESVIPEIEWWPGDPTYGQVIRPDWGRFECDFDMKNSFAVVRTSFHHDYRHLVIKIAKALKLSAFDVQTGERVYNQHKPDELPKAGESSGPPGLPCGFLATISRKK